MEGGGVKSDKEGAGRWVSKNRVRDVGCEKGGGEASLLRGGEGGGAIPRGG